MKACEHSLHDLPQVSHKHGRADIQHASCEPILPLFETPSVLIQSKAQNEQICSRNPHLKGYFPYFYPSVLSKNPNSTTT